MLITLPAPNTACSSMIANVTFSGYTTVVTMTPPALTRARNFFITGFIAVSERLCSHDTKPFVHSVSLAFVKWMKSRWRSGVRCKFSVCKKYPCGAHSLVAAASICAPSSPDSIVTQIDYVLGKFEVRAMYEAKQISAGWGINNYQSIGFGAG